MSMLPPDVDLAVYSYKDPEDESDRPITWPHKPIPPRDEWLVLRQRDISASKIAPILGISKYCSRQAGIDRLRAEYRGQQWDPPSPVKAAMEWGNAYEGDAIAQLNFCLDRYPYATGVFHCNTIYSWSPDNPNLTATLDGVLYKGRVPVGVIEVKCPSSLRFPGDRDARGRLTSIPPDYILQVQWQMMVTGLRTSWLVYYRPAGGSGVPDISGHLRIYRFDFNPVLMDQVVSTVLTVWEDLIVPDVPVENPYLRDAVRDIHEEVHYLSKRGEQIILPLHYDTGYLKKKKDGPGR